MTFILIVEKMYISFKPNLYCLTVIKYWKKINHYFGMKLQKFTSSFRVEEVDVLEFDVLGRNLVRKVK